MRAKPFLPLLPIVLCALLAACSSDEGLPSPTPVLATPTLAPASINITRKDYDLARAKWESQGIEEYEVEISEIPHASNIAVSVIYYVRGPYRATLPTPWPTSGAIATPDSVHVADYPDPIDSSFAKVDKSLRFVESKDQTPWQFRVEFDPTLGYPSYFQEDCLEDYPYQHCPTDSFSSDIVVRLEVLKRRQP